MQEQGLEKGCGVWGEPGESIWVGGKARWDLEELLEPRRLLGLS